MNVVTFIYWLQTLVSVALVLIVIRRLALSIPKNVENFLSDRDLPSISVLVPARNEDQNLQQLLETIVANDYPKLEVLVLDDCSTGKNISMIVKEYAHEGVRFIQGEMPNPSLLAKNQAYHTLANQATGEWLIFIGVDVRLSPGSLRGLVHYAINHNKTMLSVLPQRSGISFWNGFFTPLRYFKEFIRIGIWNTDVPTLSTAWLIKKDDYLGLGGIESVSHKIIPEHYFAKILSKQKKYQFIRTNDYLKITTAKSLSEQLATTIRVNYPSHRRRLELTLVTSIGYIVFLFLPFYELLNTSINGQYSIYFILSLLSVICLTTSHLIIVAVTNPILWPLALINFPYLVLQEITLSIISMCRYEFGEINWKGRNICVPVMHVIPRLPKLD